MGQIFRRADCGGPDGWAINRARMASSRVEDGTYVYVRLLMSGVFAVVGQRKKCCHGTGVVDRACPSCCAHPRRQVHGVLWNSGYSVMIRGRLHLFGVIVMV
jgi:hypothetical protein